MYRGPTTGLYPMTEAEIQEACAEWFAKRFGGPVEPDRVTVSVGHRRTPEGMGIYSDEPFASVVVSPKT